MDSSDVILLGHVLSKVFLDYWPAAEINSSLPKSEVEFAKKINKLPKTVFSNTTDKIDLPGVRVAGNIVEEIAKLKQQPGKNLILYGGAGIVQSFMKLELIDEYHLMLVPVVLGSGLHLFKSPDDELNLKLIKTIPSKTGVVILNYKPVK